MKHSYADYVPAIKAMSDETRLKIIDMLSCGEMCACDILEEFSISQSTLSYHMKILSESGLVNAVRDGGFACNGSSAILCKIQLAILWIFVLQLSTFLIYNKQTMSMAH
jgi:DNA-binding transcriptional ArsR family regulator